MDLYNRGNRVRKTTPEQRQEMRDRYRAGETRAAIAKDYNVSPSAVTFHTQWIDKAERDLPPVQDHGTPAAYRRHQHRGEPGCDPCKAAWNAYCQGLKKAS